MSNETDPALETLRKRSPYGALEYAVLHSCVIQAERGALRAECDRLRTAVDNYAPSVQSHRIRADKAEAEVNRLRDKVATLQAQIRGEE